QENAISAVNKIAFQRVYVGDTSTDISSIGLPETVPVSLADGSTVEAEVANWQEIDKDWNPDEAGVYTFEGVLEESEEMVNPFDRTATIHVYNRLTPPNTARETEWLDRGVIALQAEEGIFVSWRLLMD